MSQDNKMFFRAPTKLQILRSILTIPPAVLIMLIAFITLLSIAARIIFLGEIVILEIALGVPVMLIMFYFCRVVLFEYAGHLYFDNDKAKIYISPFIFPDYAKWKDIKWLIKFCWPEMKGKARKRQIEWTGDHFYILIYGRWIFLRAIGFGDSIFWQNQDKFFNELAKNSNIKIITMKWPIISSKYSLPHNDAKCFPKNEKQFNQL